jgi:hypothetical protein
MYFALPSKEAQLSDGMIWYLSGFFADSPIRIFKYKEAKASESRSYRDENEREYYIMPFIIFSK